MISKKTTSNSDRKSNFELLRIIAMLMIVFHHVDLVIPNWSTNINFTKIFVVFSLGSLGKAGVDLFALITGYFMYNKVIKAKRFFRVWLDVDFYSWLTLITLLILGVTISFKDIVKFIFPVVFSLRWYATAYLILYLLLPFVNLIIRRINPYQFSYLLLILLLVLSIMPTIKQNVAYSDLAWIMFVYLIGAFISKYNKQIKNKSSTKIELLFLFGSLFLIILSIVCVHFVTRNTGYFKNNEGYFFYQNYSILVLIFSICLFMLFDNINLKSNVINSISKLMFGVYLSHAPILKFFLPNYIRNLDLASNSRNFYIFVFFAPLIIFLFFSALEYVRLKLLNNLLDRIANKLSLIFSTFKTSILKLL